MDPRALKTLLPVQVFHFLHSKLETRICEGKGRGHADEQVQGFFPHSFARIQNSFGRAETRSILCQTQPQIARRLKLR